MTSNPATFWKTFFGYLPLLKTKNAAAAGAQSVVTKVLITAVNVATSVLTARLLGPEGRGELAIMVLWQFFLAGATSLGLPSALIYNLKRRPEAASQIFAAALLMIFVLGSLAAVAGVFLLPVWLAQHPPEVVRQAQFLLINTPVVAVIFVCRAGLEARGEFAASNKTLLLTPLSTLVGLILLIAVGALTPFKASLMYVFAPLPICVWMIVHVWRKFRPKLTRLKKTAAGLLHYGVRAYGIDLLGIMSMQMDQILVVGLLSARAMGMYVVALNLSRMLLVFQTSAVMVLFPKIAARPVEEVVELTGRAARISMAISFLASIAVLLLGPFMMGLLYGTEFLEAVPALNLLIIETGIGGTMYVSSQGLMALNRPGLVTLLQGCGIALSVPLLLFLIPRYGLIGASLALLCSATIRLVLVQLCYPLLLNTKAPSLLLKRDDIVFLREKLLG